MGGLPEDASRKGCGVRTPEKWKAGRRYLGRLETHAYFRQLASGDPPWRHPACVSFRQLEKNKSRKRSPFYGGILRPKIDLPLVSFVIVDSCVVCWPQFTLAMGRKSGITTSSLFQNFSDFWSPRPPPGSRLGEEIKNALQFSIAWIAWVHILTALGAPLCPPVFHRLDRLGQYTNHAAGACLFKHLC